jgi:hypothetical protein
MHELITDFYSILLRVITTLFELGIESGIISTQQRDRKVTNVLEVL